MVFSSLNLGGGLLLGIASSLHCAGMCGPIAGSLMFGFGPNQTRALIAAQTGRVLIYVLAGTLAGSAGGAITGGLAHPGAFLAMRAAAALSLGWIGLSLLGLAPSPAIADRFTGPVEDNLRSRKANFVINNDGQLSGSMSTIFKGADYEDREYLLGEPKTEQIKILQENTR